MGKEDNEMNRANGRKYKLVEFTLCIALLLVPLVMGSYLMHVMILIFLFGYLGQCWNILGGYAGQLSIGHAAYYGVGAYTSSLLFMHMGLSPWVGMIIGAVAAGFLGVFTGYLCFRFGLKGPYYALATMAFAEILRLIALNTMAIGGAQGILIPLEGESFFKFQFVDRLWFYYISFGLLVFSVLVVTIIERSKLGYYLKAIHKNEDAAEALGIDVTRYKLIAACLSASLTALGGSFYAQYTMYIEPDNALGALTSVQILLQAIIGGAGTVYGPVLGSFILTPLSELTRSILGGSGKSGASIMVIGATVMFVCIFMQKGVFSWLKSKLEKYYSKLTE